MHTCPQELADLIALHREMFGGYTMMADAEGANSANTDQPAEPDWKAESRKWEARAKENSAAAARLAELEEASKTEAQKAAERLAAAEAKVKAFETREQVATWRAEVAKESGVPVEALAGSTREELAAHAAILKPLVTPGAPVIKTQGQEPTKHADNAERDAVRQLFGGDQ